MTLVLTDGQFEDLQELDQLAQTMAEGGSLQGARDDLASERGFVSWEEMCEQAWTLTDGLLAGDLDGQPLEVDFSELIPTKEMTIRKAWMVEIRTTILRVLPENREPHARFLLVDGKKHENSEYLDLIDEQDAFCAAMTLKSGREMAMASAALAVALDSVNEITDSVDGFPMLWRDAVEHARRHFEAEGQTAEIWLERPDTSFLPGMDDHEVYGVAVVKGDTVFAYEISSFGTEFVAKGSPDQLGDTLSNLDVRSREVTHYPGIGDVKILETGAARELLDDLEEEAEYGFDLRA